MTHFVGKVDVDPRRSVVDLGTETPSAFTRFQLRPNGADKSLKIQKKILKNPEKSRKSF